MLQVAVHGDHVFPLRIIEAGRQSGRLPKVAAQLDDHHAAIDRGNLLQQREGVIAAAVVHENQLKGFAGSFHHHPQPVVHLGYVLLFVVKGYDDGVLKHSLCIITALNHFGPGNLREAGLQIVAALILHAL